MSIAQPYGGATFTDEPILCFFTIQKMKTEAPAVPAVPEEPEVPAVPAVPEPTVAKAEDPISN